MIGARRAVCTALASLLGIPMLPGCALMHPARLDIQKAMLVASPRPPRGERRRAATLMVFPPRAPPLYDTTQMAYSLRPGQVAYFSRHEWGETPPEMLQTLLMNALQDAQCFDAITTPLEPYAADYALHADLVELIQDFSADPAILRLSLRLQVGDERAHRVIASQSITLREPLPSNSPEGGVKAAGRATTEALQEIVRFVLRATFSARSGPSRQGDAETLRRHGASR